MKGEKTYNRIAIIVGIASFIFLWFYAYYSREQREKNIYVYEEHLDDSVVTVDNQTITLREFGYYILKMEDIVQAQALVYNPEDPTEYWNLHFSAGLDSGYMFEYAWNYAVADCICDMAFEKKAKEKGMFTILNPAPANEDIIPYLKYVDLITPNETEMEILGGKERLFDCGITEIVTTLGADGYERCNKNSKSIG